MITLGLETSGRSGSVALVSNCQLVAERQLSATGRRHARTLVPEIGRLLADAGLTANDVGTVAVSIGPGSFTGLRVGCVCAKTFAYAADCRIVAVDTFLAVAAAVDDVERMWVIDDALRGDVFAGEYVREREAWSCLHEPQLLSLDDWQQRVLPQVPVSGPGVDKLQAELESISHLKFADPSRRFPQAAQVALLGARQAESGNTDDPWSLEPRYIRRSAAEEKADSQAEATSDANSGQNP